MLLDIFHLGLHDQETWHLSETGALIRIKELLHLFVRYSYILNHIELDIKLNCIHDQLHQSQGHFSYVKIGSEFTKGIGKKEL